MLVVLYGEDSACDDFEDMISSSREGRSCYFYMFLCFFFVILTPDMESVIAIK